ncbi:MAG TPA: ABC transporter permease [Candidatus Polarisedimenticolia bacterium]|jgi:putative ABC transport system permease protein|nr:ABC transporter permease [Candidatus Polarisedimenticolia bacterium]
MSGLLRDLRYGLRTMRRSPGFAAVAILTLALGIGATTVILSVARGVLFRPLPFREADRLVLIWDHQPPSSDTPVSYSEFLEWREHISSLESVAAYFGTSFTLTGEGEAEEIWAERVSAALLPMLDIEPVLGRPFRPEEDRRDSEPVAIISHALWKRRYGADPGICGRTMNLSGKVFTIVGVLPPRVAGVLPQDSLLGQHRDIWAPLRLDSTVAPPDTHFLRVIGRLRPGVPAPRALEEARAAVARLERPAGADHSVSFVPLQEHVVGRLRPALLALLGAVSLLLLIACANVAGLLLARATARRKEIALRMALGAGRPRLVRQLLTESLMLAALGGGAGLLLSFWGLDLLVAACRDFLPRADEIAIDGTALLITILITVATGILFGLAPAAQVDGAGLERSLREGGRSAGSGGVRQRLRGAIVVGEIALSLVLLVGAGLLGKSFARLLTADKGFDPENVLSFSLFLPFPSYPLPEQQTRYFQQALETVSGLPGVTGAAAISELPLSGAGTNGGIHIEGRTDPPGSEPVAEKRIVTPDYFGVLKTPLLKGRAFLEEDRASSPAVAIVNEALARRFFPGQDPIGRRIDFNWETKGWQEIVGVVGNVKQYGLQEDALPAIYVPHAQRPEPAMTVVVRSTLPPADLVPAIQRRLAAIDRDRPMVEVRTLDQVVADSVADRRLPMLILGGFAAAALLLGAIGVYGIVAYSVAQRTQEFGLRMALGARRGDVVRLVLGQGLRLALWGLLIGLLGAFAAARLIAGLLFGTGPSDPVTLVATSFVLLAVALLACYVPARRAARVDPMVALRCE